MKKYSFPASLARYGLLLAIMVFGSIPTNASATGIDFLQNNNILYYDPGGQACSTVGTPYSTGLDIPILTGSDNAEKIWNFLKSQGLSDEQAAGVMGNIEQESGYDPTAIESNGIGFGIIQWSFERRDGFAENEEREAGEGPKGGIEQAAEKAGVPATNLGFQLKYMVQEAQSLPLQNFNNLYSRFNASSADNAWDILKKQETIEDATVLWHDGYERSGDTPEEVLDVRGSYAEGAFDKFKGRSAAGNAAVASGGGNCSAAGSGDLIATLLEYAHPEYHPGTRSPVTPAPKPAYQEVTKKIVGEGRWVGGGAMEGDALQAGYPGIDCGGFVSVLLTQSGFEPDYNYGLDTGRGASNQNGRWSGGSDISGGQMGWAMRNWTFLGRGGEINVSDLQPGDVAYSNGHTFLFVGNVTGFDSQFASASYASQTGEGWRSPMSAGEFESATAPGYVWYGRRPENGSPPAYGSTDRSDAIIAGNEHYPGEQGARDW